MFPCELTVIRYDTIRLDRLHKTVTFSWHSPELMPQLKTDHQLKCGNTTHTQTTLRCRLYYQSGEITGKLNYCWTFKITTCYFCHSFCVWELKQDQCFCIRCFSGKHEALRPLRGSFFFFFLNPPESTGLLAVHCLLLKTPHTSCKWQVILSILSVPAPRWVTWEEEDQRMKLFRLSCSGKCWAVIRETNYNKKFMSPQNLSPSRKSANLHSLIRHSHSFAPWISYQCAL